ncbi:unnamed protein product [Colias eurytheme]|nr:unnamed protein product [Colias eurytheme]
MYLVVKCALILCAALAAHGYPMQTTDVIFHLFTPTNPTVSQPLLPSIVSISMSSFSNSRKTIIAIHSDGDDVTGNFVAHVVPAHLRAEDVNILVVDWSRGSFGYSVGVANVPQLGDLVADFVNILINSFGYNVNLIRIVGFGLGAHAAGAASRKINGVVPHIVALDPPLLGWTHNPHKLKADDAAFVEVLHTSAGAYGYGGPIGKIDFYANGGAEQPMCGADYTCSHMYAYVYYAESITADATNAAKFVGRACASRDEAEQLSCGGDRDATFGGTAVKSTESGIYVFLTNLRPPFALG